MKKSLKSLLLCILFIFWSSSVFATNIIDGLVRYYDYDTAGDATIFDSESNRSMTEVNNVVLNASCIKNGCAFFNDVIDGYKESVTDWNVSQWDSFTMCYWMWDSGFTNDGKMIIIGNTGLSQPYYRNYQVTAGTTIDMHYQAITGTINLQTSAVSLSVWQLRCYTMNGTTSATFKNGVKETIATTVARISALASASFLSVNANFGGQSGATWYVDEMSIWNVTLPLENMTWLYNSGEGRNYTDISQPLDLTPPTNSSYNITSGNIFGQNSTAWNQGKINNFSSNLASATWTCNENCNSTWWLDNEGNYTEAIANNSNHKCETTDTTSQSCTLFDNISIGDHFICVSLIDSLGNEQGAGKCSAILNLTRINPLNGTVVDSGSIAVNDSSVYIINMTSNAIEFNTTTNSSGRFIFDSKLLPEGIYLACSGNKNNFSQGADAKLINVSY